MTDTITVTGLVATQPRHLMTADALPITSFRLVSTQRRFDRSASKWVDGDSNWFTITAFRQLALNSNSSVKKGDRVVVTGRLRIRDWESGERAGTTIEIEAESLGHDLTFGTSAFTRSVSSLVRSADSESARSADDSDVSDGADGSSASASASASATDGEGASGGSESGWGSTSSSGVIPSQESMAVPF